MGFRDGRPDPIRPNHYPEKSYFNSPCIHCRKMLKFTGANSGVTWVPVDTPPDGHPRDWWTCWENEVGHGTFGGHEPWEAIRKEEDEQPQADVPALLA